MSNARRPLGPIVVLVAIALVPAVLLAGVWRFADARAGDPEPLRLVPEAQRTGPAAEQLGTGLLSWRRTPAMLSRELNLAAFESDVQRFVEALGEDSCVEVSLDGMPVGRRHARRSLIPASTLKVAIGAVALERLGPDYRFSTGVHAEIGDDGVARGNLVLVGGGDPLLTSGDFPTEIDRRPVFNETSLDELADAIVAAGVRRVDGDVVGDGSRYDDEMYRQAWEEEDHGVYAGPIDALLVNHGRTLGETAAGSDPNEAAARELERLLRARGVEVGGTARAGTPEQLPPAIASIESAPLTDLVAVLLINSDNHVGDMLVKELGLAASGEAEQAVGTWDAGFEAITSQLERWGISSDEVRLDDGSGLSTENRMSCAALVAVLDRFGPDTALGNGLPVAGTDTTLADEFAGSGVEGRLVGKTGTLANLPADADPPAVKALAGYVPTDGDGTITFSLVLNGPSINDPAEYRPIWDELASTLGAYPSGPNVAELGPRGLPQ